MAFKKKVSKLFGRLYLSLKVESSLSYVVGKKGDHRYHFFHVGYDVRNVCGKDKKIFVCTMLFVTLHACITPSKKKMIEFYSDAENRTNY